MYMAGGTRPDIMFSVSPSKLNCFLDCYREEHWSVASRVSRYLKGTLPLPCPGREGLGIGPCELHLLGLRE